MLSAEESIPSKYLVACVGLIGEISIIKLKFGLLNILPSHPDVAISGSARKE
jgi:hypothetical protein